MYFELYLDSLFLVNFVMNLYLLLLVNKRCMQTASCWRLIRGATLGAILYLLPILVGQFPFLSGLPIWCKMLIGFSFGSVSMLLTTFPIRNFQAFCRVLKQMIFASFLLGGGLLAARHFFCVLPNKEVLFVLCIGALLAIGILLWEEGKEERTHTCWVTIKNQQNSIVIKGIIDSGNSLIEPISGKPVSIIEQRTFELLFAQEKENMPFRIIPYHSIGKQHGVMKGYMVSEMDISVDGISKKCKEVFLAVSEEEICGFANCSEMRMIVNPKMI